MRSNYQKCWERLLADVGRWTRQSHSLVSANVLLSYMTCIEDQQRLLDDLDRAKSLQEASGGDSQSG